MDEIDRSIVEVEADAIIEEYSVPPEATALEKLAAETLEKMDSSDESQEFCMALAAEFRRRAAVAREIAAVLRFAS